MKAKKTQARTEPAWSGVRRPAFGPSESELHAYGAVQ